MLPVVIELILIRILDVSSFFNNVLVYIVVFISNCNDLKAFFLLPIVRYLRKTAFLLFSNDIFYGFDSFAFDLILFRIVLLPV